VREPPPLSYIGPGQVGVGGYSQAHPRTASLCLECTTMREVGLFGRQGARPRLG
jgi:hypothetical protein